MRSVWRLKEKAGYCASVYTQITDVETECNGLMTYDRAVAKIDPRVLRLANQETPVSTPNNLILANALYGNPVWSYVFTAPSEGWQQPGFNDATWPKGGAGFGNAESFRAKVGTVWKTADIWLRRPFVLTSTNTANLKLEVRCDDDAEVYFNGVLAYARQGYLIDYLCADVLPEAARALRMGTNVVAVHCHQKGGDQFIDVGIFQPETAGETNVSARTSRGL
jgi:hypothetical protein